MTLISLALLAACSPGPHGEPPEPTPATPPTEVPPAICASLGRAPQPIDAAGTRIEAVDLSNVSVVASVDSDGIDIEATVRFTTAEGTALPVLELGPEPDTTTLDGAPAILERFVVGEPVREVVGIHGTRSCTEHTLVVTYRLDAAAISPTEGAVRFESLPDGVFWAPGMTDAEPGRFLSMWAPSNLLFDRFELDLVVRSDRLGDAHQLVSNGDTVAIEGGWRTRWSDIQAHGPLWVLSPAATTLSATGTALLAEGPVEVEAYANDASTQADLEEAVADAVQALEDFDSWFGPYAHGDRYLLWVREDRVHAMEYDGATLTQRGLVRHEVLHSWFGRGTSPVADLHGWLDEAVASWIADAFPMREVPLDLDSEPRRLQVGEDEWAGAYLRFEHYYRGSGLLAHIADLHGADALVDALGAFYVDRALDSYRAVDLEAHLTCWFDDDEIREAFLHTGYGLEGPAEARPDGWCD